MSFGAGHIQDMNNRMKQNRAQRPSNRAKFKDNNREAIFTDSDIPKKPIFESVSEEDLNKIKLQIQDRAIRERQKTQLFYAIFISVCLVLFIWFLIWIA